MDNLISQVEQLTHRLKELEKNEEEASYAIQKYPAEIDALGRNIIAFYSLSD